MWKERIKEQATYWYFFFPKWVWTALITTVITLIHVWIATSFPDIFDMAIVKFVGRLATFYLLCTILFFVVLIVLGAAMAIYVGIEWIHKKLPDDPRKSKAQVSPQVKT